MVLCLEGVPVSVQIKFVMKVWTPLILTLVISRDTHSMTVTR